MTKLTRAWPHLDDTEYERRVAALAAAANKGDADAATTLGYVAKAQGDEAAAMTWWQLVAVGLGELAQDVAGNPATPVALLQKLAEDETDRLGVATNPSTPLATLEKLAEDENEYVRRGVAGNPSTPVALLEKLAEDENEYVRTGVAGNPSTPVALLEKLAEDENDWMRWYVAGNLSTPVALLEKLATDRHESVRGRVAVNPSTPVATLELLAVDEDEGVRGRVAVNPSTPVATLELLAVDEDEDVRRGVARNPSTPVRLLTSWAQSKDKSLRIGVAWNTSTPLETLLLLSADKVSNVRRSIIYNPSAPPAAVFTAAKLSSAVDIMRAVASRPDAPEEALAEVAARGNGSAVTELLTREEGVSLTILLKVLARPDPFSTTARKRAMAVFRKHAANFDPATWVELANHTSPQVRAAVASCKDVPNNLWDKLAIDHEKNVREAIRTNPSAPETAKAAVALSDR